MRLWVETLKKQVTWITLKKLIATYSAISGRVIMYAQTAHCYQQFTSTHSFFIQEDFVVLFKQETLGHNGPIYWAQEWPVLSFDQFFSKKQKLLRRCFIYLKQPRCIYTHYPIFHLFEYVSWFFPLCCLGTQELKRKEEAAARGWLLLTYGLEYLIKNIWR